MNAAALHVGVKAAAELWAVVSNDKMRHALLLGGAMNQGGHLAMARRARIDT